MNPSCEPTFAGVALGFAGWIGGIIRSLFPWPAIVLFALLFRPLRRALDRILTSVAESLRTLRRIKAVGGELTLDPEAAREIAAKSTAVVRGDYERRADEEAGRLGVWVKFTGIIEEAVRPVARSGFRATIHIADALEPETLYQLVEYLYVSEPSGPPKTRGRRHSIRFGIIGRAWRLGRAEYEPNVTTSVDELVKVWGMTQPEAALAGRGRRSFAVILLGDESGGYSGLIFMDAAAPHLFGELPIGELVRRIGAVASAPDGLSESLVRLRSALAKEFRAPAQR